MTKKPLYIGLACLSLLLPLAAIATGGASAGAAWFQTILNNFLNMILWPLFLGLVVIMFIYAGILYLTAHGDPSRIAAANKAVIWAVVGIVVAIAAFSAVGLIQNLIPASCTPSGGVCGVGNYNCCSGSCNDDGVNPGTCNP